MKKAIQIKPDLIESCDVADKEQYDEICCRTKKLVTKYYSMGYVMDYFISNSAKKYVKKIFNIRLLYYWIFFRSKIKNYFSNRQF